MNEIKTNNVPATGYAFPPVLPWQTIVAVPATSGNITENSFNLDTTVFQLPITFRLSDELSKDGFKLPVDPIVSLSCKNVISRRYVSKSNRRGSIKECWSQDDYEITISGVFISENYEDTKDYIKKLRKYCEAKESIHITNDLLNSVYGIDRIAIESYDFPHTKGMENQAFVIKAFSDDLYELLEESDV